MTSRTFLRNFLNYGNPVVTIFSGSYCSRLYFHQTPVCKVAWQAETGFKPSKVAVVTKTTRYEFEQQRYLYAELSEEDLKQLLALKGSSYFGLLERHNIHTHNVGQIVDNLQKEGIEVRIVKRREYDEDTVRWADAIVSAGGDGTMLLVASKVFDKNKPVIAVNTDPERSEGHLCLPVRYTHTFSDALQKLRNGEFSWQWRQRIRMHLEGTGINPTPVDLHEQQLSLEQHSKAHRTTTEAQRSRALAANLFPCFLTVFLCTHLCLLPLTWSWKGTTHNYTTPCLLPVRGLNEIFIGESLSSRASYYEISIDDGPWEKQKSSGLSICTGTGSKAWSYNINKLVAQAVEDVLRIGKAKTGLDIPLNQEVIESVTEAYNESLIFGPEENKVFFSVREPIVNRVFSNSRQRGFASKICVRSRCWDACMVVDGGTSFEFNDGAIATISLCNEDLLRTVNLD
ncbi:NAD kinase 2, mitochondrial isoform X2 [Electrophorus electricus]|uniref:NAD kinase 2, mitochondrial isoform X2 n=1 Tax=Electrophorus electricus TaxID=8005 RepID=UPI000F0A83C4|nr:NAD kinase 2, mitochondrial isoform X2 [Electrophorus electricus]